MGATHHLSELRIVLLGYRYAGKSSAGNTILGREEFGLKRTAQCVMRQGEVAGRKITVVKAPGWGINKPVEHSSELLKQEISLSVSLCPPGPHVLLLVLHAGTTFKERERRVLDGHMKLFTERVWSHTIVLFIYGDRLGDITIAQHIKSKDSALQWVVEKCGNRYHVLSNENSGDDTQVTELLEKIEEMVAANSGCCFEMEKKILQELEERRRAEEERAKERMMIVHKQREDIRAVMATGVATDPEKIRAVAEWKVPNTVTQMGSFLGFALYYHFVQDFTRYAALIHKLVAKLQPKHQKRQQKRNGSLAEHWD